MTKELNYKRPWDEFRKFLVVQAKLTHNIRPKMSTAMEDTYLFLINKMDELLKGENDERDKT